VREVYEGLHSLLTVCGVRLGGLKHAAPAFLSFLSQTTGEQKHREEVEPRGKHRSKQASKQLKFH
jgi:hypothetical protein